MTKYITLIIHEPYALKEYSIFDVGNHSDYYDHQKNAQYINNKSENIYLPIIQKLQEFISQKNIHINLSISGIAIEQFNRFAPQIIEEIAKLIQTEKLEILGETYFHSLACNYSQQEFKEQIQKHTKIVQQLFNQTPQVFYNNIAHLNNQAINTIKELGFKLIIIENSKIDHDHININGMPIIIQNQKNTIELNQTKTQEKIHTKTSFENINTIFNSENNINNTQKLSFYNKDNAITTQEMPINWHMNDLQKVSTENLYEIEGMVNSSNDAVLKHDWQMLTNVDYMEPMNMQDPQITYESHLSFMNILEDIKNRALKN